MSTSASARRATGRTHAEAAVPDRHLCRASGERLVQEFDTFARAADHDGAPPRPYIELTLLASACTV